MDHENFAVLGFQALSHIKKVFDQVSNTKFDFHAS